MSAFRLRHALQKSARAIAALCGVLVGGCFGGQTGGEISSEEPAAPWPPRPGEVPDFSCRDEQTVVALGDASALGFSGADVLAMALGTHRARLAWNAAPQVITFGPEAGESEIALSVEYRDGPVHLLRAKQGTQTGPELGCQPDRIAVEVTVHLTTAGGALAETFTTSLLASAPNRARLSSALAIDELAGAFLVDVPASYRAVTLSVNAELAPGSFTGTLGGTVESRPSSDPNGSASAIFVEYARWP